jgi:hypothetical protein
LRGDERWVEDDIGFVDFKVVGAGIQNDWGKAERGRRIGKDTFQE